MSAHLTEDRLAEYALGNLPDDEQREVAALVAQSPAAQRTVAELRALFAGLGEALSTPQTPTAAGRARLLSAADPQRLADRLLAQFGAMIDATRETASALLEALTAGPGWEGAPWPDVRLRHLPRGPAIAAAVDAGLVEVRAGAHFPFHTHRGDEHVLVLQGGLRDEDGTVLVAGDTDLRAANSSHAFQALGGVDLVYAVVLYGEVDFTPRDE
jgi:putative transcriptional regulator